MLVKLQIAPFIASSSNDFRRYSYLGLSNSNSISPQKLKFSQENRIAVQASRLIQNFMRIEVSYQEDTICYSLSRIVAGVFKVYAQHHAGLQSVKSSSFIYMATA
nr:hypothetical transcript [Hymenolepis microstoma]